MLYAGDCNVSINPELDNRGYFMLTTQKPEKLLKKQDVNRRAAGCLEVEQPTPERLHLVSGWF